MLLKNVIKPLAFLLIVPLLLAPVSCTSKQVDDTENTSAQETTHIDTGNLTLIGEYSFQTQTHQSGETVYIHLSVTNDSDAAVDLNPYPPEVLIQSRVGKTNKTIRTLDAGTDIKTIGPGEYASFHVNWDQLDSTGTQVPYGIYEVQAANLPHDVESKFDGGTITIEPVQGTLQKSFDLNESIETGAGKLSLEQLTIQNGSIHITAIYIPDQKDALLQTSEFADAEYSVDDRPIQYTGFAVQQPTETRMQLFWTIFDIVAIDATSFTFTITTLGDTTGEWSFKVPLQ